MPRNLLYTWGGHMVFFVAGFVLPRQIDRHVGQQAMGVWDFGWSIVNYFGLAGMGIGSSVNRHVAKYRAEQDYGKLNASLSSVMVIQFATTCAILVATFLAAWLAPNLLGAKLGDHVGDARVVIVFLGASIATRMMFDTYGGVMTGCHRWDMHNLINSGFYGATVVAMLTALALGGGLKSLAIVYFLGTMVTEIARSFLAGRVCPELRLRLRYANREDAKRMFGFGGKAFITSISNRLLYQTNSIIVISCIGPAALAQYSRPMALIMNAMTFISKYASMLTPIASHLDATGKKEELKDLIFNSTRFSAGLSLPSMLFFVILGGPLLRLWMGDRYDAGFVLAILAIGHLMTMAHRPINNILTGLGAHGRPALAYFLGAAASVVLSLVLIWIMRGGIKGAAIAVGLSLIAVDGIYLPIHISRKIGISTRDYLANNWIRPVLSSIPFALCLLGVRYLFDARPGYAILSGAVLGGTILLASWWKWLLLDADREKWRRKFSERTMFRRSTIPVREP